MGWKFWRKNDTVVGASNDKSKRQGKPREIPQEVGRHLVVDQDLDPDWIWSLKCVRKSQGNSKSAFDIRIFSSETVAQHGVKVTDYASLDNHMDLVIFAGWYDKNGPNFQLEQLINKAV